MGFFTEEGIYWWRGKGGLLLSKREQEDPSGSAGRLPQLSVTHIAAGLTVPESVFELGLPK